MGETVYPNSDAMQPEDGTALIDTHCHLDLAPLVTRLTGLLADARRAGVGCFVIPGVHPDGWNGMSEVAAAHAGVIPAYGIHPMHAGHADDATLGRLEQIAGSGIAIGETGLDPSYEIPLLLQEAAFREQLRLAVRLDRPVLVHCRSAFQQTLAILREERAEQVGGIMHAFSGSPEMAREFIRLGFVISISGVVTRDNAVRPLRLARELPLDQLVLETDAPDMTPQPFRGRFNRPAWLPETARCVAGLKGCTLQELARATTATARRILRLGQSSA